MRTGPARDWLEQPHDAGLGALSQSCIRLVPWLLRSPYQATHSNVRSARKTQPKATATAGPARFARGK